MKLRAGLCSTIVLVCSFLVQATGITGTVSDSGTGDKLANAIVSLRSTNGNTTIARDTTGADGVYQLTDIITPGDFSLRATVTGYVTKNTAVTIDTSESSITSDVQLVKIDTTSLGGTVTDSVSGDPISGAIVSIGNGPTAQADTTGTNGAYSFDQVASGSYSVRVTAPSFMTKTVTVAVAGTSPVTADIKLAQIMYATVSGTVSDSATPATLVTGAVVALRSGNTTLQADTTGEDGKYQFDSVASGNYTVRATASGYTTKNITTAVSGSATVTVDIPLVKILYSSVSGTVTDSATPATLIVGAVVALRRGNSTVQTDTTGEDGTYRFDSVAIGAYTVRATANWYVTKTVDAAVTDETAVTADIALVKAILSSISGTITDSVTPSTLISGAVVSLRSGNTTIQSDTTGTDGAYEFGSVPVGNYTVRVSAAGYVTRNVSVALPDTTTVTLTIAILKILYGSLSGTVKDSASGAALEGAIVSVRSGNMTIMADTTGSDGTYAFDSIPTGVYTIRAADSSYITLSIADTIEASAAGTLDFLLVHRTAITQVQTSAAHGDRFTLAPNGILHFGSGARAGDIMIFGLNGKLVYRCKVTRSIASLTLPGRLTGNNNALIIRYVGPGFAYQIKTLRP